MAGWAAVVVGAAVPAGATSPAYPPIEPVVITGPLPGFTEAPPGPTNGPLTATEFAAQSTDPRQAEAQFDQLADQPGFAAYLRLWTDINGPGRGANDVVVALYRIPRETEAATFADGSQQPYQSTAATPFTVPSIPGARGYTVAIASPARVTEQIVVFRSGAYVSIVQLASSDQSGNPTSLGPPDAIAVAYQQYVAIQHATQPGTAASTSSGASVWLVVAIVALVAAAAVAGWELQRRRRRRGAPVGPDPWAPDGIFAAMGAVVAAPAPDGDGVPSAAEVPELAPVEGPGPAPAAGADAPGEVSPTSGRPPAGPVPVPESGAVPAGAPDGAGQPEAGPRTGSEPGRVNMAAGTPATPVGRLDEPAPGTPASWLPDPSGSPDVVRFWDGLAWTSHVAVRATDR
jgi:hypothetical protein